MQQIEAVRFRFDDPDRQELMPMLPAKLHEFRHRDDPDVGRNGAEMLIQACEEAIGSYRTVERLTERFGALNRANCGAAIRKLRRALEPFVTGAMDPDTVDVLLGAFLGTSGMFETQAAMITLRRVDAMLADRERELSGMAITPWRVRERQRLRGVLSDMLQGNCAVDMTRAEMARFLARVLDAADIPHDEPEEHSGRLIPKACQIVPPSTVPWPSSYGTS
jgi:hypothetical protein